MTRSSASPILHRRRHSLPKQQRLAPLMSPSLGAAPPRRRRRWEQHHLSSSTPVPPSSEATPPAVIRRYTASPSFGSSLSPIHGLQKKERRAADARALRVAGDGGEEEHAWGRGTLTLAKFRLPPLIVALGGTMATSLMV